MTALRYPHKAIACGATPLSVAPGVHWLRMPLPMDLDHINLYLLDDGERFWIVDTGLDTPQTREYWQALFVGAPWNRPLAGVICTHMHTDHIGLSGWLCRTLGAPLYMTRGEYLSSRVFAAARRHGGLDALQHIKEFYAKTGVELPHFDPPVSSKTKKSGEDSGAEAEPSALPLHYRRIKEGSSFCIGGREWRVLVGSGHSPEHACLYCPELGLMISGDQILPRITPNVSVLPTEPEGDPLRDWFESLVHLRQLPAETLVLPAHNLPFYGLHQRIDYLSRHHTQQLRMLYRAAHRQHRFADLLKVQFGDRPKGFGLYLAIGECLAHLHFLCYEGRLQYRLDAKGHHHFSPLRGGKHKTTLL